MTNKSSKFGELLKKYRESKKLTHEEVANIAGCNATYICLLEKGRRVPSRKIILGLAKALKLDKYEIDSLLSSVGKEPLKDSEELDWTLKEVFFEEVKNLLKDTDESLHEMKVREIKNFLRQLSYKEPYELGIWEPNIICGFSGFQDTTISIFVAESLRISSELISWSEIPRQLGKGKITFAIHNPSAFVSTEEDLVFCLPPLFKFKGHAIYLSENYVRQKGISETDLRSFEQAKKAELLKGTRISVEENTDLEVAVFKVLSESGLKREDVEWVYQESEEGFVSLIRNKVDAFCGGLNHALALRKYGFTALFPLGEIKLNPVNGIVTTQENFDKYGEDLKLFMGLWFRIINLIKRNFEDGRFVKMLAGKINNVTKGTIGEEELKKAFNTYEEFYTTPTEWKKEDLEKYVDDVYKFYKDKYKAKTNSRTIANLLDINKKKNRRVYRKL